MDVFFAPKGLFVVVIWTAGGLVVEVVFWRRGDFVVRYGVYVGGCVGGRVGVCEGI